MCFERHWNYPKWSHNEFEVWANFNFGKYYFMFKGTITSVSTMEVVLHLFPAVLFWLSITENFHWRATLRLNFKVHFIVYCKLNIFFRSLLRNSSFGCTFGRHSICFGSNSLNLSSSFDSCFVGLSKRYHQFFWVSIEPNIFAFYEIAFARTYSFVGYFQQ